MKKIISICIFLIMGIVAQAQVGIGFYPLGSMASLRWNPQQFVHDSSKIICETNYNYHLELRSTLSVTNNNRGTSITAQPEVAFFHHIAGNAGGPNLLSGIGLLVAISHNDLNSAGAFIPLVLEYVPQFNFTHNITFDLETDLLLTANRDHYTARFRPLFSVSWIFSPLSANPHR